MRMFVGHDAREQRSFDLAMASARAHGFDAVGLYEDRLRTQGLFTRPVDTRDGRFDLRSGLYQSTAFALARFAVPLLAHSGWAMFIDCDMLVLREADNLLREADPRYAVQVVKHDLAGLTGTKMDAQIQKPYARKLWSAVMLFNCEHPANRRLNLSALNDWHRHDLHGFAWLHDDEIGSLSPEWHWIADLQPQPAHPAIAHWTLGTPEIVENAPHADLWHGAIEEYGA